MLSEAAYTDCYQGVPKKSERRTERGSVNEQHTPSECLSHGKELTGADRAWASKYQVEDALRYSRG
jgi:hypothetical protein